MKSKGGADFCTTTVTGLRLPLLHTKRRREQPYVNEPRPGQASAVRSSSTHHVAADVCLLNFIASKHSAAPAAHNHGTTTKRHCPHPITVAKGTLPAPGLRQAAQ